MDEKRLQDKGMSWKGLWFLITNLKVIFSRCMEVAAIPERERERERVRERIGVEMKSRSF